jgi:hypothetical protein
MSEARAPFPSLEDDQQVGQVLRVAVDATTAAAGINGQIGFSFKDASGNVILPQLDSEGKLPVTFDSAGTILRSRGTMVDLVPAAIADLTSADITLGTSKTYIDIGFTVTCRRAAYFQLVQVNDAVTTILYDVIVDAGKYTEVVSLNVDQIASGSTGTQKLKIRVQTLDKTSNVYATLTCKEVS